MVDLPSYGPFRIGLIGAALVFTLGGCGSSSRLNYDSPQDAFERGKEYYDQGDFSRAVDY
ncbi:MAG: hypothetical protein IIA50_02995, partial [Bacteroidetes bacterium]|nr:hypothetical protein [Bacteroidota bacterium]